MLTTNHQIFRRSVTISLVALVVIGAAFGQDQNVADGSPVRWPSFETALKSAKDSGKIVLIDVFAPTCPWCRKMQAEVYTDEKLQAYLYSTFEIGRIDISIEADTVIFKGYELSSAQLGAGFGASGTPTTIFMEPSGEYITRLPGYHGLEDFRDVLKYVGSESYRDMSFADYLEIKE
ncbi:MAG: thioredoxin fold domain-containing protein [Bacteroidetes bacterium]|nr:thioredoxin fold domain-containing protein [Bacteroidota bacterium]MCH8246697.1 thioredoxin fold domain-containing protein [Bacteroidota bacterium]